MLGDDFVRLGRELSRSEFVFRCPHPFIAFGTPSSDEEVGFETRSIDFSRLKPSPPAQATGATLTNPSSAVAASATRGGVFPVLKSARNPYVDRISLGRTSSCDIVFHSAHVSKLHAHFLRNADGTWDLRDAGSSNGTFIAGRRLGPDERIRLHSGDELRFAFLDTLFLDAVDLYAWLRKR